jgi:hypothetical protein
MHACDSDRFDISIHRYIEKRPRAKLLIKQKVGKLSIIAAVPLADQTKQN